MMYRIDFVDLSHWDVDPIDFALAKKAGCLGVIFKVTEDDNCVDPTYTSRKAAARRAGLLTGGYHFLRPGNMAAQAAWFLGNGQFDDADRIAIDHEDDSVSLDDLKAFIEALQALGVTRKMALYSGFLIKEQLDPDPGDPLLADLDLWLAQYSSSPSWPSVTWPTVWAQQFTDGVSGPRPHHVPGIPGDSAGAIDINMGTVSRDELVASWSGGDAQPAPEPTPEPETQTITITIKAPAGTSIVVNAG